LIGLLKPPVRDILYELASTNELPVPEQISPRERRKRDDFTALSASIPRFTSGLGLQGELSAARRGTPTSYPREDLNLPGVIQPNRWTFDTFLEHPEATSELVEHMTTPLDVLLAETAAYQSAFDGSTMSLSRNLASTLPSQWSLPLPGDASQMIDPACYPLPHDPSVFSSNQEPAATAEDTLPWSSTPSSFT
jgi:hypothetical protein